MQLRRLLGMDDISNESRDDKQKMDNDGPKTDDNSRSEDKDESEYPPFRIVILSMLSIYFAFFLSALVRFDPAPNQSSK